MLKVGNLTKISHESGFTLMELIVVLVIISIMIVFTFPEFVNMITKNDADTTLNRIAFTVKKLKNQAENQKKNFFMCVNSDANNIYIRDSLPDTDSLESNVQSDEKKFANFSLPEDLSIDGVEFRGAGYKADNTAVSCIEFYKRGYSDNAIIHISDKDGNIFSCLIRPFLHNVKIYKKYVQFE